MAEPGDDMAAGLAVAAPMAARGWLAATACPHPHCLRAATESRTRRLARGDPVAVTGPGRWCLRTGITMEAPAGDCWAPDGARPGRAHDRLTARPAGQK